MFFLSLSLTIAISMYILCVLNTFPSSKSGNCNPVLKVCEKNQRCNPTAVCRVPGFHVLVPFRFLGPETQRLNPTVTAVGNIYRG